MTMRRHWSAWLRAVAPAVLVAAVFVACSDGGEPSEAEVIDCVQEFEIPADECRERLRD